MLSVTIDGTIESIFEEISKTDPRDGDAARELCDRYGLFPSKNGKRMNSDDFKEMHSDLVDLLDLAAAEDWRALETSASQKLHGVLADAKKILRISLEYPGRAITRG